MSSSSGAYGYKHPPTGKDKRTIQKYKIQGKPFYSPEEILEKLQAYDPDYSPSRSNPELLLMRDKALISLIVLSCSRISEPLRIRKAQIDVKTDPEFVLIRNYMISKTRKFTRKTHLPVPPFFLVELPLTKKKKASLYPFTEMFLEYVATISRREDPIFTIGERRARGIISSLDPLIFPHYLRGCMLTYFCNTIKNPLLVAKTFGVRNIQTLDRYYGKTWESAREELSR
jgi:integrase